MPFIPHTPESLLPRSDSKNPAATCQGLTSTGRPCRRAIARPLIFSRSQTKGHDPDAYCWQHKDQALASPRALPQGLQSATIRERTSVDTLVDRLGLMEIQEQDDRQIRGKERIPAGSRQSRLHPSRNEASRPTRNPRRKPASQSNLSFFCCVGVAEEEPVAPRPVRTKERHNGTATGQRESMQESRPNPTRPRIPGLKSPLPSQQTSRAPEPRPKIQTRSSISRDPSSRTAEFLSLIPPTITPQITSLLLAELAKPVSIHDEEGYIYIFWLTPTSLPSPPPTSSLLSPHPSSRPAPHHRRTSEILQTFSNPSPNSSTIDNRTILLKIGRASNVQRRLNEWSRQCGHNLSLIRYYPYNPSINSQSGHSSGNSGAGGAAPTKVPHVRRIERLIHLELAAQRAKESGKCGSCGSLHREWFEVGASREGIRGVDEVVRRWVDWGVRNGA